MTIRSLAALIFLTVVFAATNGWTHCQMPCGIYDDEARLQTISEDVDTIEKAVKMIKDLEKAKEINHNQLVRWITNKEIHAGRIQESASQYFLAQRIKFDDAQYDKMLKVLHQIIVYAMKCKQTVDDKAVEQLREACQKFEKLYLEAR